MLWSMLAEAAAENGELLPETFEFLHAGWWILYLVAIPVVFLIGFAVGKKKAKPAS